MHIPRSGNRADPPDGRKAQKQARRLRAGCLAQRAVGRAAARRVEGAGARRGESRRRRAQLRVRPPQKPAAHNSGRRARHRVQAGQGAALQRQGRRRLPRKNRRMRLRARLRHPRARNAQQRENRQIRPIQNFQPHRRVFHALRLHRGHEARKARGGNLQHFGGKARAETRRRGAGDSPSSTAGDTPKYSNAPTAGRSRNARTARSA